MVVLFINAFQDMPSIIHVCARILFSQPESDTLGTAKYSGQRVLVAPTTKGTFTFLGPHGTNPTLKHAMK